MAPVRVRIIVITSAIIVPACLKEERKKKIDDMVRLAIVGVRWSLATLTVLLLMKTLKNDW